MPSYQQKLNRLRDETRIKLFGIGSCNCDDFLFCSCLRDRKVSRIEQEFLFDQRTCRRMAIVPHDTKTSHKYVERNKRRHRYDRSSPQLLTSVGDDIGIHENTTSSAASLSGSLNSNYEPMSSKL